MCNCIEVQEKKIIEHLKQKYPGRKYDEELNGWDGTGFKNQAITFGEDSKTFLYQDFSLKYTFTKVNGDQSKPLKHSLSINPAYCMFCGVKF